MQYREAKETAWKIVAGEISRKEPGEFIETLWTIEGCPDFSIQISALKKSL